MILSDPVEALPLIGPKQSAYLKKLEIESIGDLLYHFPIYYRDTSKIVTLEELNREEKLTVRVILDELKNIRIRGGRTLQKGRVSDSSGSISVTWFNQPFLIRALPLGSEIYLSGKLSNRSLLPELVGPDYELVKEKNLNLGKIVPVYPLTRGIGIKWLRARIAALVEGIDHLEDLRDDLEQELREEFRLLELKRALIQVHLPESEEAIALARRRLAFDELLEIYLKLIRERQKRLDATTATVNADSDKLQKFVTKLPFSLTPSQYQAVAEIHEDLAKSYPMNRLLQGDVGSGKTIVALLASLPMIWSGYQVVLLAPTTVLAQQHFQTITKFAGEDLKIGLITNETAKSTGKKEQYQLIIATHSILFRQELLHNLGLLIVDEQHRFGVEQRQALLELKTQSLTPHLLNLTATPIPRSIALTLFGEIEVSVIEKPPGRKVGQSYVVPDQKRADSYNWIRAKLEEAAQIFWICPLIEEETPEEDEPLMKKDMKAVLTLAPELQKIFADYKVAVLHGRMKSKEKDAIIKDFHDRKYQILVSTTVVEVGIDIPGANIIVIENAERYGLAQLHQLRGRVGRANQDSWTLLFTSMEGAPNVIERLSFFSKETNGIKIAEFDLKTRGPGEVYGTIQSGIPKLKVADFGNADFLLEVRAAAQKLLKFSDKTS